MAIRVWRLVGLAAAALVNSGCAMYSETRDKQGQDLSAAWEKVNLQAPVEASRKNFASLLEEQMKFEDELWLHSRSVLAEQMLVSWTVQEFKERLASAVESVAGTKDQEALDALIASKSGVELSQSNIDDEIRSLALKGAPWPGCEATVSPTREAVLKALQANGLAAGPLAAVSGALNSSSVQKDCAKVGLPAPGGALRIAQVAAEKTRAQLLQEDHEKKERLKELQTAAGELVTAQAALAPEQPASVESVKKAKDKFKSALANVVKLQSAIGQSFLAQEELDTVNEFLTTYENVAAGKGAPEGSNRLAIALALFPELNDQAKKALQDLEKPNLVPLVQQKQLAQAKLAAAERDVQRQQTLLALQQTHVDQLMARLESLNRARKAANKFSGDGENLRYALVPAKQSPLDLQKPEDQKKAEADLDGKVELWPVAALYLYAEGNLRAEIGKTRQRILAASYEQSIDYAEAGLTQWKALLDPSVELMAGYGKSGTRIKDIQDFVNTVALFWIAVETGK